MVNNIIKYFGSTVDLHPSSNFKLAKASVIFWKLPKMHKVTVQGIFKK